VPDFLSCFMKYILKAIFDAICIDILRPLQIIRNELKCCEWWLVQCQSHRALTAEWRRVPLHLTNQYFLGFLSVDVHMKQKWMLLDIKKDVMYSKVMSSYNYIHIVGDDWWPQWVWVGECFFWYRLTWVVPDKIQRAVKWLCVCV